MRPVGVHVSIAGGIHRSLERADELGCSAVQIFSHNPRGWSVKPLAPEPLAEFHSLRKRHGMYAVIHASYLINLASVLSSLREKSVTLMKFEMDRADQLGIEAVVLHPGRASGQPLRDALSRAADSLNLLARFGPWKARVLLENMGGAKGDITSRMTDLGDLARNTAPDLVGGICLDTCHLHTSGYDLRRKDQFQRLVSEVNEFIGLERIRLFHVNDAKAPAGSGLDRHEHIGQGTIGAKALGRLVNYPAFRQVPIILETPQESEEDDRRNLARIHDLLR